MTNVMETLVFICLAKNCHHPPSRLMAILPIELRPTSMAMPSAARAKGKTREGRGRSPTRGRAGRAEHRSAGRGPEKGQSFGFRWGFGARREFFLAFFCPFGR